METITISKKTKYAINYFELPHKFILNFFKIKQIIRTRELMRKAIKLNCNKLDVKYLLLKFHM
jgi:hypothetical protein